METRGQPITLTTHITLCIKYKMDSKYKSSLWVLLNYSRVWKHNSRNNCVTEYTALMDPLIFCPKTSNIARPPGDRLINSTKPAPMRSPPSHCSARCIVLKIVTSTQCVVISYPIWPVFCCIIRRMIL